jgi:hypothetical protein
MKTFSSKKSRNLFLAAALVVGSLVFNVGNVAAQGSLIKPIDPSFQNGVEKYVGSIVPGARDTIRLHDVGFSILPPLFFDLDSISLATGNAFFLSDVRIEGAFKERLFLTIGFVLPQGTIYGQDFRDTLTIRATGTAPFVLPLRGSVESFVASPSSLSFSEYVAPGDRSEVKPVVVIDLDANPDSLVYSFSTNAFYATISGHESGIPSSITVLDVWFTPPVGDLVGTVFYDTLAITDRADTTGWVQKIPVSGRSLHTKIEPGFLDFGSEVVTYTKSLDVKVETREASIGGIVVTDAKHFFAERADGWNPTAGGTLHVTFTPDSALDYSAYLVILDDVREPYIVRLTGEGKARPVLSADPPSVNFADIEVGTTASATITVTLAHPLNHLDYNSFSLDNPDDGIFSLVSVEPGSASPDAEVVLATVSFTPPAALSYSNALIVRADSALDLRIPLDGNGLDLVPAPALSPQQTTAISGPEAATTPALSVKDGNIIVSGAPAGSSIQVYNLQGQSLKAQAVTSNVEILKTEALPQSVYVVLVNDKNQEILKQKVVL